MIVFPMLVALRPARRCLSVTRGACLLLVFWFCAQNIWAVDHTEEMKVTLLGTGTPYVDPSRFGSVVLVQAGGKKLLFDCGRGVIIRLSEADVNPSEVDNVFLTHLHSDHVVGIPDVWLTGWFLGREKPLRIWGPQGTRNMAHHLASAFSFDVAIRISNQHLRESGAQIDARDIQEGIAYEESAIRVTAFKVDHGAVSPAFGYRVDYSGHSVVISGDTRFSQNLINFAKGTDCLIHVAWSANSKDPTPPSRRSLASAEEAAQVFARVQPKLAVIYHYYDLEGLESAIHVQYKGPFEIAKDLMDITIGDKITWNNPGIVKDSCH